ncbi:nucleotide-binding protein [Serratia ureilytica]
MALLTSDTIFSIPKKDHCWNPRTYWPANHSLCARLQDISAKGSTDVMLKAQFSRKVFIVHGHDDGARETVARFLERIGLEAIILHEQANQGRTIIEKVVAHSDVGFAVFCLRQMMRAM